MHIMWQMPLASLPHTMLQAARHCHKLSQALLLVALLLKR